jgi:hypothetical protein
MKIFQVKDEQVEIIEHVLDSLSRHDSGIDNLVYCVVFKNQMYNVGYWNANPANLITAAGYISMDANMRYMKMNREEFEREDEVSSEDVGE